MRSLSRRTFLVVALLLAPALAVGGEIPKEYRETVNKGLAWMVKKQHKDGHWGGNSDGYSTWMTAMGGVSLLCEGSTIREGKYRDNISRATKWLMDRARPDGLIGDPARASEGGRYMYGHGHAMLFLSCVLSEDMNVERRERLVEILGKAAKFTSDAQTTRRGWGFVSGNDGSNFDEGLSTVLQLQALRAARAAGVVVCEETIAKGRKYLVDSTNEEGGVVHSLAFGQPPGRGDGQAELTAGATACAFSAGDYDSPSVLAWLRNCQTTFAIPADTGRLRLSEYENYYFAQVAYGLGEDRFERLFPKARASQRLSWSRYRTATFQELVETQSADGSWELSSWGIGKVLTTACHLTAMQLDRAVLPIYQR